MCKEGQSNSVGQTPKSLPVIPTGVPPGSRFLLAGKRGFYPPWPGKKIGPERELPGLRSPGGRSGRGIPWSASAASTAHPPLRVGCGPPGSPARAATGHCPVPQSPTRPCRRVSTPARPYEDAHDGSASTWTSSVACEAGSASEGPVVSASSLGSITVHSEREAT